MRGLLAALTVLSAGMAEAASLTALPCPGVLTAETHRATCSRFSRETEGATIAFDLAVFSPSGGESKGHVIYLPGGPGEAPMRDGPPADIFPYLREHTLVIFDPRGTGSAWPRLTCDLGDAIWNEVYSAEEGIAALTACRARLADEGIDTTLFTSHAIAQDADVLVRALGIDRAGIYGISYGTEPALHLLSDTPDWLDFAILDSVSVPGISGIEDESAGRDRFLSALDRRCFAEASCGPLARDGAANLKDWAAQFDDDPLEFTLSRGEEWSFDGIDMLDYLGALGTYVEGHDIALHLMELLATSRLQALAWMRADLEGAVEFAADALPLMLQAYSDTFASVDFDTIDVQGTYPTDVADSRVQLELQRYWRGDGPREAPFIGAGTAPMKDVARVLVLSGGIDPVTPVEWAAALEARFAGMTRYVFPLLGHAASLGNPGWVRDEGVSDQMLCANAAVRAFLDPTMRVNKHCRRFRVGDNG